MGETSAPPPCTPITTTRQHVPGAYRRWRRPLALLRSAQPRAAEAPGHKPSRADGGVSVRISVSENPLGCRNSIMTAAARRRGRPSKGDRRLLTTRVPTPLGAIVIAEAEARGMSWGDYLADIIAVAHQYPKPSESFRPQGVTLFDQEEDRKAS